jgi:flagellin-like protein
MTDGRDEAVSEVLSTALMIGVAIALAVAVFFFVHILTKSPRDAPPNFAMTYDETGDSMQFVRSTNTYDLSSLRLGMSAPGHYGLNAAANASSPAVGGGSDVALAPSPGTAFAPGDRLEFCADGSAATRVAITIVHPETETLLLRHVYDSVRPCL